MMGCAVFLLSLIGPRVALAFVWIFTGFVDRAFEAIWVPVLGFVFLPWTTLVYSLLHDGAGVSTLGWFFVALALLGDIGSLTAAARGGRRRQPPPPAAPMSAY